MTAPLSRTPLALPFLLAAAACSTDDGPTLLGIGTQAASAVEAVALMPDPHHGGQAQSVQLVEVRWGRLVDVYAADPATGARVLALRELVVGAQIGSDGLHYELADGALRDELTILHPQGSPEFRHALRAAHEARARLEPRSLDVHELPPFPVVPRNAALELAFDDLIDPGTILPGAVELFVGAELAEPFAARVLGDPNHGALADLDGDGVAVHAPTRVIVDLAPSELEAALCDPPLEANPAGLPAAGSALAANAALCVARNARPEQGAPVRLANLAGAGVSAGPGAHVDAERDALALAFRSGGPSDVTGDTNMGFLGDAVAPTLVGELRVELSGAVPSGGVTPLELSIPRMSWVTDCTTTPKPGDRLSAAGFEALVVGFGAQDATGIDKLRVRVLASSGALPIPGPALLLTAFDPDIDEASCFVRFTPGPIDPPVTGILPEATVRLRFSEPMAAETLRPFDTFRIKEVAGDPSAFELVVGLVVPSPDATRFRFEPSLPFAHELGQAETYYIELASGPDGPTDLAGNPLADALPLVPFTMAAQAPRSASEGIVFRFDSADELYDDGLFELHGQHLFDLANESIGPRPVSRFPISADRDKPLPSVMTPFPPGVQGALNPLGAKLHSLWRYVDVGFSSTDETNYNVDVEGMAWAPVGGNPVADQYDEFQISLGHSVWQPDEVLNPMTGFPYFPSSGLVKTFAQNFLPPEPDGGTVVHPKQRGYVVNPGDLFTGVSGTMLMPWPLNQGIPLDQFEYYTWRDSALLETGGELGAGVPLYQEVVVLGLPTPPGSLYEAGEVRSVALPLLMEFRCYPDLNAIGLNAFDVSLAVNSSARPNFRAFSAGGIDTNGVPVAIDPDLANVATGGHNPASNPPGAATPPTDCTFFIGQLDLITRVSRSCSIWLPTFPAGASFAVPVVESQAGGSSSVTLAYRGATDIVLGDGTTHVTDDANHIDIYGEWRRLDNFETPDQVSYLGGDATWRADLQALDGSAWFQFRATFVGDAVTSQTAALDSLGFAFAP